MKNFFLLISFTAIILSSCNKDITGCTDPSAINYNSVADTDNYSCEYEGGVVFWYNQSTSQYLSSNGVNSLIIRVNNQIIGSYSTSVYYIQIPSCDTQGVVSYTSNFGNSTTESALVNIQDGLGNVIYEFAITLEANNCIQQELGI